MDPNKFVIRGEWAMSLEFGYFWHKDCPRDRLGGPTHSQAFDKVPKTPYCSKCHHELPHVDRDFFVATWHLLNLRKGKNATKPYSW